MFHELTCVCGRQISSSTVQAGETIYCACGAEHLVPENAVHHNYENATEAEDLNAQLMNSDLDEVNDSGFSRDFVQCDEDEFCTSCNKWVTPIVEIPGDPQSSESSNPLQSAVAMFDRRCPVCQRVTFKEKPRPKTKWVVNVARICFFLALIIFFLSDRDKKDEEFTSAIIEVESLIDEGKFQEALKNSNELVEQFSKRPYGYFVRAGIHRQLNHTEDAIRDYTQVISLNTGNSFAGITEQSYHQRAHIYDAQGETDKAFSGFTKSLELDRDNEEFLLCRGRFLIRQKEYDDAIFDLRNALEIDPAKRETILLLSSCYVQTDRTNAAIDLLSSALEYPQPFPEANKQRAFSLIHLGEYDLALADLKVALKGMPDDLDAIREQGRCYLVLENNELAKERFDRVLSEVDDAESYYLRAGTFLNSGDLPQALEDAKKAIQFGEESGKFSDYKELEKSLEQSLKEERQKVL